jgi:hypothetical protein
MAARYHHDYAAFRRHVLKAPFMAAEMLKRAERVKARAEITAPFDPDDPDGQHYRDAFSAEVVEDAERVRGRVSNSDKAALFVEFGTEHNPRHRTLGNALDAAGD